MMKCEKREAFPSVRFGVAFGNELIELRFIVRYDGN